MKIFLAMPYSQLCDENYILKPGYKDFCESLTTKVKELGCEYFLAHEREKWGKNYSSDVESTTIDFETIKECDLICIIPGVPNSGGVHVEIGWASASKRKLNIFLKEGAHYSPMVTGIHCLTDSQYYYYQNEYSAELVDLIISSIKSRINEGKEED